MTLRGIQIRKSSVLYMALCPRRQRSLTNVSNLSMNLVRIRKTSSAGTPRDDFWPSLGLETWLVRNIKLSFAIILG